MDLITSDIKQLYKKFLIASITSALATSVYTFVDSIAVGQAEGPTGSAAMAAISPFYGIMVFLAILCGIGGSVLMSKARGGGNMEKGNAYFTASILLMGLLTAAAWVAFGLFYKQIFMFFGADEALMPKVMDYQTIFYFVFIPRNYSFVYVLLTVYHAQENVYACGDFTEHYYQWFSFNCFTYLLGYSRRMACDAYF